MYLVIIMSSSDTLAHTSIRNITLKIKHERIHLNTYLKWRLRKTEEFEIK